MKNIVAKLTAAAALALAATGSAYAATIDFGAAAGNFSLYAEDGYSFGPARIVNGNCVSGACLALNRLETTVMTFSGGAFTLDSVSFDLQGALSLLSVFDTDDKSKAAIFWVPFNPRHSYLTVAFGDLFTDVTSVSFTLYGFGNVRIDNVNAVGFSVGGNGTGTVDPVLVPAAGWLMSSGLLGLIGFFQQRKVTLKRRYSH